MLTHPARRCLSADQIIGKKGQEQVRVQRWRHGEGGHEAPTKRPAKTEEARWVSLTTAGVLGAAGNLERTRVYTVLGNAACTLAAEVDSKILSGVLRPGVDGYGRAEIVYGFEPIKLIGDRQRVRVERRAAEGSKPGGSGGWEEVRRATVLTLFEPLLLSSPCSSHCCCPHPVLFRELLKFLFLFLL